MGLRPPRQFGDDRGAVAQLDPHVHVGVGAAEGVVLDPCRHLDALDDLRLGGDALEGLGVTRGAYLAPMPSSRNSIVSVRSCLPSGNLPKSTQWELVNPALNHAPYRYRRDTGGQPRTARRRHDHQSRTAASYLRPIENALTVLGRVGRTKVYELVNQGEIVKVSIGRRSIHHHRISCGIRGSAHSGGAYRRQRRMNIRPSISPADRDLPEDQLSDTDDEHHDEAPPLPTFVCAGGEVMRPEKREAPPNPTGPPRYSIHHPAGRQTRGQLSLIVVASLDRRWRDV